MVGSRKMHTKTRNGCGNCKRRRVKCNLQPPQCDHCKRRGEDCDFQHLNSTPPSASASMSGQSDSSTVPCIGPPAPIDQGTEHTELMWHFGTSTSTTLALFNDTRWTWETEAPLQAETNPFLLHGLIAVSALHICFLQPPDCDKYHSAACRNYSKAMTLFRSSVVNINKENCIAVLAFSLLISVFQLGVLNTPGGQVPEQGSLHVFHTLSALRGAWSLISQLHPHLAQSRIQGLFIVRRNFGFVPLDDNHLRAFDSLESLNGSSTSLPKSRAACEEAIGLLRGWFSVTAGAPTTWLHLVYWPSKISEEFVSLLKMNDPLALVIFCHWCVGMNRGPKRWFLVGWARRAISSVVELLSPEWYPSLEWPIKEIM